MSKILRDAEGHAMMAAEESSRFIDVSFFDAQGTAVTPNDDIVWSLRDANKTIVNSRSAVSFSPPAQTITIELSGKDLATEQADPLPLVGIDRFLLVTCTYNSTEGNDKLLKQEWKFQIDDFKGVP